MEGRKKRVGVLTMYHDNTNFGATLQAYALQHKIIGLGYDACVLDFIPHYGDHSKWPFGKRLLCLVLHPTRFFAALSVRVHKVLGVADPMHPMFDPAMAAEWERLWPSKRAGWERFCRKHIHATMPFTTSELQRAQKQCDILLVGSDQVWNPGVNTDAYFLPYEKEGRLKLAYAASIAVPRLTWDQKLPFRKWLPDFDCVTVRESEGKRLLESFLDIPVKVVLDPVFFLTTEEWGELAESVEAVNQVSYREGDCARIDRSNPYILFLALGTDQSHREYASNVARRLEMRLVIVSTLKVAMAANQSIKGEEMVDVTPGQFLSLVRDASLVITDSFHCMAFSIIFRKNFYVLRRDLDKRASSSNSRIYSLCRMLGLEKQIVSSSDAQKAEIRDDLYDGMDERFGRLRERSEGILEGMLRGERPF